MEERNGGSKWRGQFSSQAYSVEDLREENEAADLSKLHNAKRYSGKQKKKNKKRHVLSHRNAQRVGQLSSSLVQFYFAPLETKLSASCQWLLEKSYELMGLDMRSLALWRICLAITSLCDLWDRIPDLYPHYSALGVLPTSVLLQYFWNEDVLCFHLMGGTWQFEAVLFAVHALICMMMLVGYRTRLATFLNWLLTSSLQGRNPFVLHGGDDYVRLMLFCAMFLPLGHCYSIDNSFFYHNDHASVLPGTKQQCNTMQASQSQGQPSGRKMHRFDSQLPGWIWGLKSPREKFQSLLMSPSNALYILQLAMVYTSSVFYKVAPEWVSEGTATYYAIQMDFYRTWVADLLIWMGLTVTKPLTFFVLWWEFWGFFFLVSPILTGPCRLIGVLGFMCMHLGFGSCMKLGQFVIIGSIGSFGMLPPLFWDKMVFPYLSTPERLKLRVRYDGRDNWVRNLVTCFATFFLLPCSVLPFKNQRVQGTKKEREEKADLYRTESKDEKRENGFAEDHWAYSIPQQQTRKRDLEAGIEGEKECEKDLVWLKAEDSEGDAFFNMEALLQLMKYSPLLWPIYYLLNWDVLVVFCDTIFLILYKKRKEEFKRNFGEIFIREQKHRYDDVDESSDQLMAETPGAEKQNYPNPRTEEDVVNYKVYSFEELIEKTKKRNAKMEQIKRKWKLFVFGRRILKMGFTTFNLYLLVTVLLLNMSSINPSRYALSETLLMPRVVSILRLQQSWRMFSPRPPLEHWWHSIHGTLQSGSQVEILKSGLLTNFDGYDPRNFTLEVNEDKPADIRKGVPNHRWYKLWESFNWNGQHDTIRLNLGRYICREWNRRYQGEHRLKEHKTTLTFERQNLEPYNTRGEPKSSVVWHHIC